VTVDLGRGTVPCNNLSSNRHIRDLARMPTLSLISLFLLLGVITLVHGYAWNQDTDVDTVDSGLDSPAFDLSSIMKRAKGAGGWCARWGDFCRPDAKMKYAQCCDGLRCMCGSFWTQGKCQCKSKGTFGR